MPTNQHRVTCTKCGSKRVEKYMYVKRDSFGRQLRYGHFCLYANYEKEFCNGVRLLKLTDTQGK